MALNGLADTEYDDENTTTTMSEGIGRDKNHPAPPAVEEPWEAVDETGNAAGVLIVPPEEDALSPRSILDAVPQPPLRGETSHSCVIELDLSFPGSVPSDIGSVHSGDGLVDNDPMNQRNDRDDIMFRLPGPLVIRRGYLPFAVCGLLVLLSLVSTAKIHFDKSTLLNENLQLKRELLEAKEALVRQSELRSKQEPSRGSSPPPPVCVCSEGGTSGTFPAADDGTTTIVDNCWFRAKANVHLGECADNAKNVVQEKFFSFQKSVQKGFRAVSESWTVPRRDDVAPSDDSTKADDDGVGVSLQGFGGAFGVLISGVAALAASTVIEELVSHILEPQVEKPDE